MCCTTAGSDMASGSASSLTEAGPRLSRTTIERRLGSASAWNALSSVASASAGTRGTVANS